VAATTDIAAAMTVILVAVFALYLKTKNLHWHMSGPRFRDYHLLLDGQVAQFFAMIDPIAERMRKVGGTMLKRQVNEKRRGERQRRMMFARQEINAGLRVMGALNVSAGPSCL
jgi:DNA-binding ferritin-like protein